MKTRFWIFVPLPRSQKEAFTGGGAPVGMGLATMVAGKVKM